MKNNYLIGFLVLTVVVLGYFVLKGGNATTEEQNQTSAAATAKLETYSNATTAQPIQKATTIDQPPINYTFTKTLASGMKSDEVTKLQQVLAENVYYEGEITGVMDKLTVQELKDFQTDNGLEVTGTTGPKTRALLSELSRHHGPCAGGQPAIRVRKPNGGEVYQAGQQVTVRWRTCNYPLPIVNIILAYYQNGGSIITQATSLLSTPGTPNDRSEVVTMNPIVQGVSGRYYKIFVTDGGSPTSATIYDASNNLFTINYVSAACTPTSPASVRLISPNGGETYSVGSTIHFSWSSCNQGASAAYMGIALQDSIHSYNTYIATPPVNTTSYDWVVPSAIIAGQYKVRIFCSLANEAYCQGSSALSEDLSDGYFSINSSVVLPTIVTTAIGVDNITNNSAQVHGSFASNDSQPNHTWFEYGTTSNLGLSTSPFMVTSANLTFSNTAVWIQNLNPSTTYYYRFVVQNSAGIVRGAILSFTTTP